MRRSHLTWLAALFIACVRPAAPPAAPEPTPSPTPEVAVSFREDATSDGLTIDLYEGRPAAPGADRLATPATEPLPDAETWELLEHIPPLPAPAGVEFRVRKSTLPPPQAGEVVPFAPPTDDAPPAASGPLTVVRHSPDGAVPMAPQLSVSFSRPMIPLTSQDEAAAMVPVTLSPTPRGSWRWLGTQTLIFDADPRFPMATRYQVSIPAGTKAIDGTPLEAASSWTFETPPLTLVSSWPSVDAGPQPLEPVMVFTFDQAISPEALLPFTRLDGRPGALRLATPEDLARSAFARDLVARAPAGRVLAVAPTSPLSRGTRHSVTVAAGAPSAEGPLPSTKDLSLAFDTFGPLTVSAPTCWNQRPCPPEAAWQLEFSNPLDADAFDPAGWEVTPAVPGLSVTASGSYVTVWGAFTGRTTYTLKVPAGIRDTFGQTLAEARTFTVDVGPAGRSFVGPSQPFVTLEPVGSPGISVFTVNQPSVKVKVYREAVTDWTAWTAWWSRWRWEDARKGVLPGTKIWEGSVPVASSPDRQVETRIDLAPHLKGGLGQLIVQVEPAIQGKQRWERQEWLGWVQSTRLGLTVFQEPEALTTWVTALDDGAPVPEAKVTLLPYRDGKETSATADSHGLARADLTQAAAVVATKGEDAAILPNSPWGYEGGWVGWRQLDQLRWFVFDDKKLYKPKETVHVRGWLRVADAEPGKPLRGPDTHTVHWRALSSRGNPIGEGQAALSELGGFTFDIPLSDTPDLGDATVQIVTDDGSVGGATAHSFTIQEFRTPEFEVTTSGGDGVYALGEDATVDVDAHYYAGGGLAAAPVTWQVTSTPASFVPPGRGDWSFGPWSPWWRWWSDAETPSAPTSFTGATDGGGVHRLGMHFAALNPARPMSVHAEATVTDVNRQAWTASKDLLVHPAAWYVGLRTARTYVEAKRPIEVETLLVDREGAVVTGNVTISLRRLVWKRAGSGWKEVPEEEATRTVAGGGRVELTPTAGGSYAVVATVRDPQGRRNETELRVWVGGEQIVPDRGVDREQVTLVPDRKTWAVGETARFLVQAPFWPAEGLLTVQAGSRILETRTFPVKDASTVLEVPVTEAGIPDLTLAVDIVGAKPRSGDHGEPRPDLPRRVAYAGGTVTLEVPPKGHTLNVTVTPALTRLSPGDRTSVDLVVTDAAGRPVPNAELAVVAVDEAVLALTGYQMPNPLDVLYAARGSGIQSFHLRQWVNLVAPQPQGLGANGVGFGGGGSAPPGAVLDGAPVERSRMARFNAEPMMLEAPAPAPPSPPPPTAPDAAAPATKLRTDFSSVALWEPSIHTDSAGHARLPMQVPDSLTRYRVMVVAAAGATEFGTGEADVTARLPLMVRPSAPRFLNFGDRAELPVVLQNQTSAPLTVAVALRAVDLAVNGDSRPYATMGRRVVVPADDRVEVRFPVAASLAGTAKFQIAATSGPYADAAAGEFPVWTPATTEAFATYGTFDTDAVAQSVSPPKDVWPQFGGLEVSVSSTQLQSLTDAFLYLQTYPYACNEQLASRVVSVAALRDVLTAFSAEGLPPAADIDAAMKADLDKLAKRQNADGGWAFWRRGDESWPYLGVHVTGALVRAKAAGYAVDPDTLRRALAYTSTIENRMPRWYSKESRQVIRAYAIDVLSLAGTPAPAKARALYAEAGADGLGAQALGWLLPTLHAAKAKEVVDIQRWLTNHVTESAAGAHFVTSYSDGAQVLLHSDRVTDGVLLEALLRTTPKDTLVPKLVNGLLAHRTAGRWGNTSENGFILLALNRYFHEYEGTTPDFVARLWLGSGMVGEQRFAGRTTERAELDVPMAWLAENGTQTVTLGRNGAGRLYYRMGLRYAPKDLDPPPADRGFTVGRRYEAVDDPSDVTRNADGSWTIAAGARVRVRVEMVTPMRRYHVALVDPLPAGLEVLNPDLAVTGSLPADPEARPRWGWWDRPWYEHENLRDERVEAFTSLLWDGVYTYTYVARATTPGTFVVPPAKAEEMYSPETFGRSGGDKVIVR